MNLIRLNKHLKDLGVSSRRKADEFIAAGLIKVNGNVVTELGFKINPAVDKLEILRGVAEEKGKFRYILLNKPCGYVCSKSELDGKTIFELLPKIAGLTYAGRLDKDSSGLIILSNDGKFVYNIAGSEFAREKEYIVRVNKPITGNYIYYQGNGLIKLDGKPVKPAKVKIIDDFCYHIVLKEGMNRQIRRMAENQGYKVLELKRIRIEQVRAANLELGKWRDLNEIEIKSFIDSTK